MQFVAVLNKILKIFVFSFSYFNSSFFLKYFPLQYSARQWLSKNTKFIIYILNVLKVILVRKISALNKKSYLSSVFILCSMFLSPLSLDIRCITALLRQSKLQNGLEFSLEILVALLAELPSKHFDNLKFKIWSITNYGVATIVDSQK